MISSQPKSLRIGLYGAGPHGLSVVLPALTSLGHALEAACDPRANLADELAERFAFRATFTELEDMVRDTSVQALIVTRDVPNVGAIVEGLLKSRLPFWVDAAAPGLDELSARLKRRSGNGPTYMICHPHRFGPAFVRSAELFSSGRLERPSFGSLEVVVSKAGPSQLNLPIEYIVEGAVDLLSFLLGPASRVYAAWDGEAMLAGLIHFDSTAVVVQIRREAEPEQAGHCLRLHGKRGEELCIRNLADLSARQGEAILARSVEAVTSGLDICRQQGWTGSLASFLAAVGRSGQDSADMTGFLQTRKLRDCVIRSASTGKEVRLRI